MRPRISEASVEALLFGLKKKLWNPNPKEMYEALKEARKEGLESRDFLKLRYGDSLLLRAVNNIQSRIGATANGKNSAVIIFADIVNEDGFKVEEQHVPQFLDAVSKMGSKENQTEALKMLIRKTDPQDVEKFFGEECRSVGFYDYKTVREQDKALFVNELDNLFDEQNVVRTLFEFHGGIQAQADHSQITLKEKITPEVENLYRRMAKAVTIKAKVVKPDNENAVNGLFQYFCYAYGNDFKQLEEEHGSMSCRFAKVRGIKGLNPDFVQRLVYKFVGADCFPDLPPSKTLCFKTERYGFNGDALSQLLIESMPEKADVSGAKPSAEFPEERPQYAAASSSPYDEQKYDDSSASAAVTLASSEAEKPKDWDIPYIEVNKPSAISRAVSGVNCFRSRSGGIDMDMEINA
jgi:hypothetical protein